MMKVVPTLMNPGFISHKTFEAICKSFDTYIVNKEGKLNED